MIDQHVFIEAFTIVLVAAGLVTVLFQKLKQPVLMGYLVAGVLVGPYLPTPLVADKAVVHLLSEIGVVLLLFGIGLEFSITKFLKVGLSSGLIALIQAFLMIFLGVTLGRMLGWSEIQSVFLGGMLAVSSSAVVTRTFQSGKKEKSLKDLVIGILVAQDLIAIILMAALTAVASGSGFTLDSFTSMLLGLGGFLAALVFIGILLIPRLTRFVSILKNPETNIITSIGLCFAIALLAKTFGYSMALGAFIAGSLVAESGAISHKIARQISPIRDLFTAIFFVSIGMQLNPMLALDNVSLILLITVIVIVGQTLTIALGTFITGRPLTLALEAGLSLSQIGEFSFLIVGIGLVFGVVSPALFSIAVSVAVLTTWTTPYMVRHSSSIALFISNHLPSPLQTFASLYGSWLEQVYKKKDNSTLRTKLFRWLKWLGVDILFLVILSIAALKSDAIFHALGEKLAIPEQISSTLFIIGAVIIIIPLFGGIIGLTSRIAREIAITTLPLPPNNGVDSGLAPRRVLSTSLHIIQIILISIPMIILIEPIAPTGSVSSIIALTLFGFGVAFWKRARNLDGHVKAGAQVIASALQNQLNLKGKDTDTHQSSMDLVNKLLPGMGHPETVELKAESFAVDKSLSELNLRALTGALVMAISSQGKESALPTADTILRSGDVLVLSGSEEAIKSAHAMLHG
ncbi:MAG: cation:proton antiporter [Fibrobacterales bacterium]